jgi:hypothetical protein
MPTDDQTPSWQAHDPARGLSGGGDPPMLLTLAQQLDLVTQKRAIAACRDVGQLQKIAIDLLETWHAQRAATIWAIGQQAGWRADGLQSHPVDR